MTYSEHASNLKGNCSVCNFGCGVFEKVKLFHTNQFSTTQDKDHLALGYSCRIL